MNVFNESIYKSHLEHSTKGQTWSKHKYIAIKNGRYIYPEDLQKGGSRPVGRERNVLPGKMEVKKGAVYTPTTKKTASGKTVTGKKQLIATPRVTDRAKLQEAQIRAAHRGEIARSTPTSKPQIDRSRQINDQIKSAHSNATSSKMDLTPGKGLQKQIEATAKRKEDAAKAAEEAKKKEEAAANPATTATTTTTEEKKSSGSGKGKGGGKKGSGSKKSSSKKEDTTKKTEQTTAQTAANASEEAKALGLTDDDMKLLDSNIDVNATDRETVIKNLALRVIKGDFGNGADRKKKLGKYYSEIQKKVNELMKELKSSKSSDTNLKHSNIYTFNVLKDKGGVMGMKSEILCHGNRNSGRYPRGSGDRPWQHEPGHNHGRSSVRDMSDDDLKKAVARKGLEKQYKKMYKDNRLEDVKDVVDATSSVINRVNNKNREKLNRRPQRERMNLDGMTDKELRDRINRELLEKQYSDLFGPEKQTVTDGERKVAEILDCAGDVVGLASSALLMAVAIKKLKG